MPGDYAGSLIVAWLARHGGRRHRDRGGVDPEPYGCRTVLCAVRYMVAPALRDSPAINASQSRRVSSGPDTRMAMVPAMAAG